MYKITDLNMEYTFYDTDNQERATRWIDKLLQTTHKVNLLNELNTMQTEAIYSFGTSNDIQTREQISVFKDKYSIPLYFINLILYKYDLKMVYSK